MRIFIDYLLKQLVPTIKKEQNPKLFTFFEAYRKNSFDINYLIQNLCIEASSKFHKIGLFTLKTKDSDKHYQVFIRFYKNESGENYEFLINDITLSCQAEQESFKNKFRGLTLAKIAHELKNPLTAINVITKSILQNNGVKLKSCSDLSYLDEELDSSIDHKKCKINLEIKESSIGKDIQNIQFINCMCDYLLLLIEDLNSFVKMDGVDGKEKIETTELVLNDVLNFCFMIMDCKQKHDPNKLHLKIVRKFETSNLPFKVMTNETKLKQVLLNLISNAYKFTPAGEVRLKTNVIHKDNQEFIRISVEDDGEGMTPEEQERLFKPFTMIERHQKANHHGSGLGLTIVKDTLEMLGSKIMLSSTIGKGSCFFFDLSLVENYRNYSPTFTSSKSNETEKLETFFFFNDHIKNELLENGVIGKYYTFNLTF